MSENQQTEPLPAIVMVDEGDDIIWEMRVVPEEGSVTGIRAVRVYIKRDRAKPVDFLIEDGEFGVDDLAEVFSWLAAGAHER